MMSARTLLFLQQSRLSPGPRIEMKTGPKLNSKFGQATKASYAERGVEAWALFSWLLQVYAAMVLGRLGKSG